MLGAPMVFKREGDVGAVVAADALVIDVERRVTDVGRRLEFVGSQTTNLNIWSGILPSLNQPRFILIQVHVSHRDLAVAVPMPERSDAMCGEHPHVGKGSQRALLDRADKIGCI